jgi:hypothetical protein
MPRRECHTIPQKPTSNPPLLLGKKSSVDLGMREVKQIVDNTQVENEALARKLSRRLSKIPPTLPSRGVGGGGIFGNKFAGNYQHSLPLFVSAHFMP